MATSTLRILREINDYKQEFIAEDVLGISTATYSRIEQNPSRINADQAQKLSDFYQVSIANLLSEATPVITFKDSVKENPNCGNNGYVQTQTNTIHAKDESELIKSIQAQNELLAKQNAELMELVKVLKEQK